MVLERLQLDSISVTSVETPEKSLVSRIASESLVHVDRSFLPDFRVVNGSVSWEKKAEDFKKILAVKNIIDLDLNDAEFNTKLPEIRAILSDTYIFQRADDKNIKVSSAHSGVTPFEHSLNAVKQLRTTGLPKEMVRAVRWATIWHDIGKIFGADDEFGRYHSQLSAYISWEFFYTHCKDLGEELIQQMVFAIQFHHTSEGMNRKWLTEEEVENRLHKWESVVMLYVMSAADILSIPEYQVYVENLNFMVEYFQKQFMLEIESSGLLRTVLREPDTESNESNSQNTQPAEALAQPQH